MRLARSRRLLAVSICLLLISSASLLALRAPAATAGTKLQHLIFIIQENRSFDNYFGLYPGANGLANAPPCCPTSLAGGTTGTVQPHHADISKPVMIVGDELPPGQMYPNANDTFTVGAAASNGDVRPFLLPSESTLTDINHSWRAAFTDWNYGQMNGFIVGERNNDTMGYYNRSDIPYYWDYASNFVLDDNFFSSMMGPSFPNHLYIASGSAGNGTLPNPHNYGWLVNGSVIDNPPQAGGDVQLAPSVDLSLTWAATAEELTQHQVSWKWYTGSVNATAASYWDVLPVFSYFQQHPQELKQNVVGTENFLNSVKNGTLPSVSWIIPGNKWIPPASPFNSKPALADCGTSEHPPARPDCGMDYVSYLVNAIMNSQYWQSTAIVITWDDYGGFYDHVPPPLTNADGEGFRVPNLVISPYAKHGYVDHTPYEFASFLSLVESNFGLPSLGQRDSTGIGRNNMMNSFDFGQTPQPALVEPGNFIGPADVPPMSNGYPQYSTSSTSSASSVSSSKTSTTSATSTTLSSATSSSYSFSSTTLSRRSSSSSSTSAAASSTSSSASQSTTTIIASSSSNAATANIPNYFYAGAAIVAIVIAVSTLYFIRRRGR